MAATVLPHSDPNFPSYNRRCITTQDWISYLAHLAQWNRMTHRLSITHFLVNWRSYAQVENEALSIIFSVKKFHQFFYRKHFILVTGHKTFIPLLAAVSMQSWALLLSGYSYNLHFRPTTANGNANCLSWLPLNLSHSWTITERNYEDASIFSICQVEALLPIHAAQLMAATTCTCTCISDLLLSKVLQCAKCGLLFTTYIPSGRRKRKLQ